MADSQTNDNTTCVVCFKNVLYYSIGECDHPVCFECSTRMRVLCLQNECPICRRELSRVVFTETIHPYKELCNKVFSDRLFERQFKIWFCSHEIRSAYERLLENRCKICDNQAPFRAFTMLSDHMRKVHERYFCDLCVKHLKIFTSERKCYTRQELAHHRRKGDLDDTSHRGHPLCEFCEERFMDADELYRHLRKEHLYCHLCDADGRNLYYATHASLAQHFRSDHFLCEEGECAGQHLTAVFRSDIDLKAHKATVHGRGMPRGAARQARTLELQFNITPHPVVQRTPRDRDRDRDRERERERAEPSSPPAPPVADIDTRSDEQFPRLSTTAAAAAPSLVMAPSRAYRGSEGLARTDKNFPALDGGAGPAVRPAQPVRPVAATLLRNSKPSVSIQLHSQPASASNFRLTPATGRVSVPARRPPPDDDFPALGTRDDFPALGSRDDHPSIGAGTLQPPKVASINSQEINAFNRPQSGNSTAHSKKVPLNAEAFPALSANSAPAAPAQWITVSKSKEKPKPSRPEPPPQPREPSFNPVADFPTLPTNSKPKPKKAAAPPTTPAYTAPTDPKPGKKEKKKQNNNAKKENIAEIPYVNGVIDRKVAKELSYGASVENKTDSRKLRTTESTEERNKNGGNGDFALASKDYPPLNARSENAPPGRKVANSSEPPGRKVANSSEPPGRKVANGSVPPGFKPRPACDGMTFTNSAGQTFSAPVHAYIPPPDFEQRNRALVKKFAVALGGAAAVEDFKVASRAFRDSIISAEEFSQHCRNAVGSQLDALFPELVALLPDIAKQQELVVGRKVVTQLDVCPTCGQLLVPGDRVPHDTAHWPPLNSR